VLPDVQPERRPRLAEAGRVFAAVDRVRGSHSFDLFMHAASGIAADVVENDVVAGAILELLDRLESWEGTSAELLAVITPRDQTDSTRARAREWPTTPEKLSATLGRLQEPLRQVGLLLERSATRTRRGRPWRITRLWEVGQEPSQLSHPPESAQPSHSGGVGPGAGVPVAPFEPGVSVVPVGDGFSEQLSHPDSGSTTAFPPQGDGCDGVITSPRSEIGAKPAADRTSAVWIEEARRQAASEQSGADR
jgi:hypothetical protein